MKIRTDSTVYVKATTTVDHDITGQTFQVALPISGETPTSWYPATVTDVVEAGGKWTATYRILIGPEGGVTTLTAGTSYDWTRKIIDTPEVPIAKTGTIEAVAIA